MSRLNIISAFCFVWFMICFAFSAYSQHVKQATLPTSDANANNILIPVMPFNGELLPTITIKEFKCVAERVFKNEKEKQAYLKLKRDVRKAYPYAVLASVKLREYDAVMASMSEKERGPYLKKAEKELKEQFEADLKNLTVNQGKILVRLIDRETGRSTYKVIKDYRGAFHAFMWQSIGLLWGNNLRSKYDPSRGEDKLIEEIIQEIQDNAV